MGAERVRRNNTLYLYDGHGNVVDLVSSSGVEKVYDYDAYGNQLSIATGDTNPFRYCGEYYDEETGFIYLRARYYSPDVGRFISADPVKDGVNWYAYANNNPLSYVDPWGLRAKYGPTDLQAAYMAQHIYDANLNDRGKNLGKQFGGWQFLNFGINEEGLRIGIYIKDFDGVIGYTIVNKGSRTKSDWINNIQQPFGISDGMRRSIEFAEKFVKEHPDSPITFVGHSKGGGEALANAKATNRDAIVFNPAIPNYEFYGLENDKYTAEATSYVLFGEALSSMYAILGYNDLSLWKYLTPTLVDNIIAKCSRFVFNSKMFWKTKFLFNKGWSPLDDHSIQSIIDALEH